MKDYSWPHHRLSQDIAHGPLQLPVHLLHARGRRATAQPHDGDLAHRGDRPGRARRRRAWASAGIRLTGRGAARAPGRGRPRARASANVPGIENVSMTTNGVLLPRMADDLKAAGLSRVNISLDTLDPDQFRAGHALRATAADARRHRRGARGRLRSREDQRRGRAKPAPGLPRSSPRLSIDRPLHVRFIEYMPVGEELRRGRLRLGQGRTSCPARSCSHTINEQARRPGPSRPGGSRRGTGPFGWGPARYFMFPGRAGHGRVHLAAVAPFLRGVQPPAPHGGRQAAARACSPTTNTTCARRCANGDEEAERAVFAGSPAAPSPTTTMTGWAPSAA